MKTSPESSPVVRPLTALTGLQQHNLVVLAEVHETVDALRELHHILDGLCDLHGAELPHHLPRLQRREQEQVSEKDPAGVTNGAENEN